MAKMALLAGIFGTLTSISVFAVPLDITLVGGTPYEGLDPELNPGSGYYIPVANISQVYMINLAGVTSINLTWSAPAGYMYVINPLPAGYAFSGLSFDTQYGNQQGPGTTSLGAITASSLSVDTIFGTSPLTGAVYLNGGQLDFEADAADGPGTTPFAFTSITISADFSGTGTSQTLDFEPLYPGLLSFAFSGGGFIFGSTNFTLTGDMGPYIALEPLPSNAAPDVSSTLTLAGLGFAGLLLVGRNRLSVDS